MKIITKEDKKKEKIYWTIFIAEGLSIPIAHTILLNIHKEELFISIFAQFKPLVIKVSGDNYSADIGLSYDEYTFGF